MIGVFDSGFGGLTVLKEYLNILPEYNYIYLGDNARTPYGTKSEETVYNYSIQAINFLFGQGCELIIFACNTASSKALRRIQQDYLPIAYPDKKVLGVLVPVAEEAIEYIKNKKQKNIGIIGTTLTIESGAYETEIKKKIKNINFYKKACPLLVPLIEEDMINHRVTKIILRHYLKEIKSKKVKLLILACTHYPLLKKQIATIIKNSYILDTPKVAALKLKKYLEKHSEINDKILKNKKIIFYTTDNVEKFKKLGQKFLGKRIGEVLKIKLD